MCFKHMWLLGSIGGVENCSPESTVPTPQQKQ